MQIILPVSEALALATAAKPLPPLVRSVTSEGNRLQLEIDLRLIPDAGTALKLAAAAVGTVTAALTFTSWVAGVATFEVTAQARALPAHKLLNHLTGPINSALASQGLPDGLVEVIKGDGDPVLAVRVQDGVDSKVTGLTVTALDLSGGAVYLGLAVTGTVRKVG